MNAKVRRTIRQLAIAQISSLALLSGSAGAVDLLTENFEGLTLNPVVTFDTEVRSRAAWTKSVPTGAGVEGTWAIDDTAMPAQATGSNLIGVTEFEGWTFVDKDWWINTAGDQDRGGFVSASGKIAVADPDEWDDFGTVGPASTGLYDTTMRISAIPLQGVAANTAKLFFHSSWRPEDAQKASLTVKYNDPGATTIELFRWTSQEVDPTFKPDAVNEAVNLNMLNPAGATTATLEFRLFDAGNDWWWAVDNINMFTGASPASDGALRLTINRDTGDVSIANNTPGTVNLRGYTIQSRFGTLNESAAAYLGETNSNWQILDSPEHSELSEGYIPNQYAMPTFASNPTTGKISLGASWRKYHEDISDVTFQYLVAGNDKPVNGIIEFVGNSGESFDPLDLNFNGSVEIGDYAAFLAGYNVNLAGKTRAQQYNLGDLDADGKHTVKDFLAFKTQYDLANGAGAFAAALASVPEPSTTALGLIGGVVGLFASRRRRCRTVLGASAVALGIAMAPERAAANLPLLVENFEGVLLGQSPDERPTEMFVWNGNGPAGWTVDRTGVPGVGNPEGDGVTDWAGWAFVDKEFWLSADDQGRSGFTRGAGTIMVADSDEWEDKTVSPKDFYDTFVTTPLIPIPAGTPAGKIKLAFDSSWLPENPAGLDYGAPIGTNHNQTATIKVSYNNGPKTSVLTWDSTPGSGFYHGPEAPDLNPNTTNESILLDLNYNGTASTVQIEFGLGKTYNNWWWAVDNVRVFVPAEPSKLRINTATGAAQIVGGDVISTSITGFDISSVNGNLAPTGNYGLSFTKPDSIDGDDPDSTVGNAINETWQLGAANANQFGEFFLDGNSAFTSARTESLGKIFNTATAPASRDLQFTYSTIFGDVITGIVEYYSAPDPANADFDDDGDVDGADFLRWQRGFGTGTTLAQGNADGDGDVDAADLAIWKTQFGSTGLATGSAAAVPEPAGLGLACLALGMVAALRRRFGRRLATVNVAASAAVLVAAAGMTPSDASAQAIPAPFLDRNYRMGDGDPGAANGVLLVPNVATRDDAGQLGQNQLIDMLPFSKSGPYPSYVTIAGRPDGGTGLGIRFNAGATDKNFLRTAPDEALNFPEKSPSAIDGTLPGGTLDYTYITDRGFQLWAQPAATTQQHLVMDTNNHGVMINSAGKFTMKYSNVDYPGLTSVVPNTWYHLMVVRPFGPGNGSILYVNGVAEAAATGAYQGEDVPNDEIAASNQDNSPLVIGANTAESPLTLANNSYYRGIIDDLQMFVIGLNNTSDRGEFQFDRDNKYAAHFKPTNVVDLTGDNAITMADVTIFANHWLDEKVLTWTQGGTQRSLAVGDLTSRMMGDFNYDGRVNLSDWAILNKENPAMASAAMAMIRGVPEPAAYTLGAIALTAVAIMRRRVRNQSDEPIRQSQVV